MTGPTLEEAEARLARWQAAGPAERLRMRAAECQESGQALLDRSMTLRAEADRLNALEIAPTLTDAGIRTLLWADDRPKFGTVSRSSIDAQLRRGLIRVANNGYGPRPAGLTTLGAAVLALLDDQKKDA